MRDSGWLLSVGIILGIVYGVILFFVPIFIWRIHENVKDIRNHLLGIKPQAPTLEEEGFKIKGNKV